MDAWFGEESPVGTAVSELGSQGRECGIRVHRGGLQVPTERSFSLARPIEEGGSGLRERRGQGSKGRITTPAARAAKAQSRGRRRAATGHAAALPQVLKQAYMLLTTF